MTDWLGWRTDLQFGQKQDSNNQIFVGLVNYLGNILPNGQSFCQNQGVRQESREECGSIQFSTY